MKTSNFITITLAALAVVGSAGLAFAQNNTSGAPLRSDPGLQGGSGTSSDRSGNMVTPGPATGSGTSNSGSSMDRGATTNSGTTPISGGSTMNRGSTASSGSSMNNNAAMNEPMARADRN